MHAAERQIRSIRGLAFGLFVGLWGLITPCSAARTELLSVVMAHDDTSTQVVLEFDARAGYRFERSQTGTGSGALLVRLSAHASSVQLPSGEGFVDQIQLLQEHESPAVIHLALSEPGLQIRDRVLVSPPRLVFEVTRREAGSRLAWQKFLKRGEPASPLFASARDPRPAEPPITSLRDVRIGSHPEFSRVVFELDQATSYSIEPLSDRGEIVVTLGASATTHELISPSEFVGSVRVEASKGGSVARVRLKRMDVRLSELTLANPNRIVIDIAHAI